MQSYNPERKGHMAFNEQPQPSFDQLEPMDFDDKADMEDRQNLDLVEHTRQQLSRDKRNRKKL